MKFLAPRSLFRSLFASSVACFISICFVSIINPPSLALTATAIRGIVVAEEFNLPIDTATKQNLNRFNSSHSPARPPRSINKQT
jgi:hypothetical protein